MGLGEGPRRKIPKLLKERVKSPLLGAGHIKEKMRAGRLVWQS